MSSSESKHPLGGGGRFHWLLAGLATLLVASAGVIVAVEFGSTTATGATRPTPVQVATATHARPRTARVVVRPVGSDGTPASGYRVVTGEAGAVTCTTGASPSAVDPDIRSCGYAALGTVSCWRSTGHTVLCLRDATSRTLVRLAYTGDYAAVAAPRRPQPQNLVLATGTQCTIRDGGVWDVVTGHPDWVGAYWCSPTTLYGPPGQVIDTSSALWRVHQVSGTSGPAQRVTTRGVARAYLVGTAA